MTISEEDSKYILIYQLEQLLCKYIHADMYHGDIKDIMRTIFKFNKIRILDPDASRYGRIEISNMVHTMIHFYPNLIKANIHVSRDGRWIYNTYSFRNYMDHILPEENQIETLQKHILRLL